MKSQIQALGHSIIKLTDTLDSVKTVGNNRFLHFIYPEIDISRSILSCALDNSHILMDIVTAFIKAYREHQPLTLEKLVRSVKLTWWKEADWVSVEGENDSIPLKRFREENIWVAENWGNLFDIFSNV